MAAASAWIRVRGIKPYKSNTTNRDFCNRTSAGCIFRSRADKEARPRIEVAGGPMETVVGVFGSRTKAEHAITRLLSVGVPERNIRLLAPGSAEPEVPVSETEQPGMGKAIGGIVGGAIGVATGVPAGFAMATALLPGVGPVVAIGLAGAALLGTGGALGGAAAGQALENSLVSGLPEDELYFYEDALR